MNTRIFNLVIKNLEVAFSLPKYDTVRENFTKDTRVDFLPWTPARHSKFEDAIKQELDFDNIELAGTVEDIVKVLDERYMNRFFGEIWKPKTESYAYTGWGIVDEVNKHSPKKVLDVGCGYNQFKGRIPNLVGVDPHNNCADYMIDILDFNVPEKFNAIICFGSINFGDYNDVFVRLKKVVSLMSDDSRAYFRVNPGILWKNGPYVDIFAWSFELAYEFASKLNVNLETFKKDNDRLYFVYHKQ